MHLSCAAKELVPLKDRPGQPASMHHRLRVLVYQLSLPCIIVCAAVESEPLRAMVYERVSVRARVQEFEFKGL